ncbi:MAG: hypothetical protein AAF571_09720 [Verrucomicrobiota bacterium]
MSELTQFELMLAQSTSEQPLATSDPGASPFRTTIDPEMRIRLKRALFDLIDNHDSALESYVAEGQLEMDSYKEYIELFARCLRETMETPEGVAFLLKACGFKVDETDINLQPEWRWNVPDAN